MPRMRTVTSYTGVETKIEGFKEFADACRRFPREIARDIAQETAQSGAQVLLEAARRRVPKRTGKLASLLKVKMLKPLNNNLFTGLVTVEDGYLEPVILRWLEYGTGKFHARGRFSRGNLVMRKARTMAWKRGITLNTGTVIKKINRYRKDGTQLSRKYKNGLTKNPRGFNYAANYVQKLGIEPRPILRPALHQSQKEVIQAMQRTFERGVTTVWAHVYGGKRFTSR